MDFDVDLTDLSRRQLLKLAAGGGAIAAGGAYALDEPPQSAETEKVGEEESRRLAESYAPTLYFGEHERWFPTDPRRYATEREGETVVDGFDALDGYTKEFRESGSPPAPTAFYHAVEYPDSPLAVVQFWFYSVFDQFSTNFHWHDWEVLHVFVDTDAEAAVLFVASAHARKIPNNEFIDPETDRASIISEVGSHSSALGVNAERQSFQRYGTGSLLPDVNNHALEVTESGSAVPLAYGLPRDEGLTLPYVVPELDGKPVYEDERLPNVTADDLLPDDLTVHSYVDLATPPKNIPKRETSTTFVPESRKTATGDHDYALEPIDAVTEIDDLAGPQLSFQFYVPTFAENAVASHLTSTSLPWTQSRFDQPTADITDPKHRQTLADRYDPIRAEEGAGQLVGAIREVGTSEDAPTNSGVALFAPSIEVVAMLESDPTPVPSFGGVVAVSDPPTGDHRLTVNGAGMAPYSEELTFEGGTHRVGVDGEVSVPANEDAVKVRGDASKPGVDHVAVEDDFAGQLYDGTPPGDGKFGVYVHRNGAYTAEVTDPKGEKGAVRVNPDAGETEVVAEGIDTGKAALTDYLRRFLTETRAQSAVFEDGDADGITEVTTGTDLQPSDVSDTVQRAKQHLNETAENVTDTVGGTNTTGTNTTVTGGTTTGQNTTKTGGTGTGTGNSPGTGGEQTSTATATDTQATTVDTATETTGSGDSFSPGSGFTGIMRALDAALLAAARAHESAAAGNAKRADRRLQTLRKRLTTIETVVEQGGLPGKLGPMVGNRVEVIRPRVEAAIEAAAD